MWFCFCFVLNQLFLARCLSLTSLASKRQQTRDRALFSTGIPISCPGTSLRGHSRGIPEISFPHSACNKGKEKDRHQKQKDKPKEKRISFWTPGSYSSMPSLSAPATGSTSGPPSSAPGVVAPGASLLFFLRGGGGDLHPLAACWAILLAVQASARAP